MSTGVEIDIELNNTSASNSFWESKHYGTCVRRLENGNKLCSDMCNMIQDRVDIERQYSSSLHKWGTKWLSYLDNGFEYGSVKSCWASWCHEAEALSELHKEMRNKLIDEVQTEIRNWQKNHFHKAALPPQHLKEVKSLEADFEFAQKPWAKKFKKMNQCRREYHQHCKLVRSYEVHTKNALNDSGVSQEQLKKMEEKSKKAENDCEKLKRLYESSLEGLNKDRGRYTEEMIKVFNKSQSMERERMFFFKSMFFRIQKILNLAENKSLSDIYCNYESVIACVDPDLDVKQWSQSYGSDMPFICPNFEEYTQDLHSITKKKFMANNDSGVVLTGINSASCHDSSHCDDIYKISFSPSVGTEQSTSSANIDPITPISLSSRDSSVFSDECYVRVRALYDYSGREEDELTFTQGEIFLKIEDEDGQGWCKGKKDGRVGLYPANYAGTI